ncbi:MAG: chemotaxis protein CheA [Aquabacterium sp.]|uniref:chemotaxis protein CheA n=1 Tax=Aquabacterium sp. TaxID=1872578 RepID=UPI0025C3E54F|nr:chemotaxis protein CheA [Aquabacterium sp.]MBI5926031.1 chemotaxis protein CheA [Aquabacterium sp.]
MSQIDPSDEEILAIAREGFLDEAREMLRQFEESLLALDDDPGDQETLNSAFRAAHTIKGTAGLFGCDRVVAFTHDVETLLEAVRSGQYQLNEEAMALLLSSRDQMEALLGDVSSATGDPDLQAMSKELSADLRALLGGSGEKKADAAGASVTSALAEQAGSDRLWRIWVQFGRDALRNGLDPLSFLRYLSTQGEIRKVKVLSSQVPDLQALDAEECYLGFEAHYHTSGDREAIASVFEFAVDDCELHIDPLSPSPGIDVAAVIAVTAELVEDAEADVVTVAEVVDEAQPADRRAASGDRRKSSRDRRSDETRFVRVQADKLDRLIDLVGELVIASSGAQLVAQQEGSSTFAEAALRIRTLVESARDGALALRMVPIGETFARFHRVVRDVSKQLGKQVELQITGADTELDKSMVEVIADPLMHLVRNSLDHGLETTEERLAAGKPERGVIALHAYHEGGQVMIEVTDDGRGLNRERILKKAIERGLVRVDQVLSDHEIDQLICAPGFSTADQVTDISGRGVGMDVVKRSIESLRGQMQLASEWGRGTTTQIRLPLTLAIIDGFLTSVGSTYYVLPMEIVSECIEVPPECGLSPDAGVGYFNLRGEVLPYFDIALLHKVKPALNGRRSLVVARDGNTRIGLIVDKLHGEYQTVIKPLSSLFRHLRAIAGSTILGSGDVALVLDVPALVSYAVEATRPGGGGRTPFSLNSNGSTEQVQRIS